MTWAERHALVSEALRVEQARQASILSVTFGALEEQRHGDIDELARDFEASARRVELLSRAMSHARWQMDKEKPRPAAAP